MLGPRWSSLPDCTHDCTASAVLSCWENMLPFCSRDLDTHRWDADYGEQTRLANLGDFGVMRLVWRHSVTGYHAISSSAAANDYLVIEILFSSERLANHCSASRSPFVDAMQRICHCIDFAVFGARRCIRSILYSAILPTDWSSSLMFVRMLRLCFVFVRRNVQQPSWYLRKSSFIIRLPSI